MSTDLLAHNVNLVAWIERLLAKVERLTLDLRCAENMAAEAIKDRLTAERKYWALRDESRELERKLMAAQLAGAVRAEADSVHMGGGRKTEGG